MGIEGGVGAGVGANVGGLGAGAGANVGGINAGVGVDANLNSGLFNFVGGGGVGVGLGGGVNGGGEHGGGIGVGINGGAGGESGGEGQGGSGVGGSASIGSASGGSGSETSPEEGGSGTAASAGVGGGGGAGGNGSGSGSGSAGGGTGANGGGWGVSLAPVPIVPIAASAGASPSLSVAAGAQPNASPACTVQGGPAKLLYFPPAGAQASPGITAGAQAGAPAPAGGAPYVAAGQTFQPGSAYISCETLWAGYTDQNGKTVQSGPTFKNAVFPIPSDQISTQCQTTASASGAASVAAFNYGQQMDFGAAGSMPQNCQHIAPPPAIVNMVPEWKSYMFWNIQYQPAEAVPQEGGASVAGPQWSGPESGCSVVQPTTNIVPTTPGAVATPAPGSNVGPAPAAPTGISSTPGLPAGVAGAGGTAPANTLTGPTPSSFGQYTATAANNVSATGAAGPQQFTGGATMPRPIFSKAGKSTFAVAALIISLLAI